MKDAAKKKKEEKTEESSVVTMIRIKSEIIELNTEDIAGTKFEVKKGYKLKK